MDFNLVFEPDMFSDKSELGAPDFQPLRSETGGCIKNLIGNKKRYNHKKPCLLKSRASK
jgi:hypothetical protein